MNKKFLLAGFIVLIVLALVGGSYGSQLQGRFGRFDMGDTLILNTETDPLEQGAMDGDVEPTSSAGEVKDGSYGIEASVEETVSSVSNLDFGGDGDCFLLDDAQSTGTFSDYDYLSFWLQSSESDVTYDSFGVVLDTDDDCSSGGVEVVLGDSGNTDQVYVKSRVLDSSAAQVSTVIGGGTSEQWEIVTLDLSLFSNRSSAQYLGFSVDNGSTDWGPGDQFVVDGVQLHTDFSASSTPTIVGLALDDESDPLQQGATDGDVEPTSSSGEVKDGNYGIEASVEETVSSVSNLDFGGDGDCFLLDDAQSAGTFSDYNYLSFWVQSSESDVTYDSLGIVLDTDNDCSSGAETYALGAAGVTDKVYVRNSALSSSGAAVAAPFALGKAETWELMVVDLSLFSNRSSATHFGFAVLDGSTDWGPGDQFVVDEVNLHDGLVPLFE